MNLKKESERLVNKFQRDEDEEFVTKVLLSMIQNGLVKLEPIDLTGKVEEKEVESLYKSAIKCKLLVTLASKKFPAIYPETSEGES